MRRLMTLAATVAAITAGIAVAQPRGTTITLDGKEFKIGDWGFPYWSGKREIYTAYRHGRGAEISYNATINIENPGDNRAGWDVSYKDVKGPVSHTSCPEEERIMRDMARLAGFAIQSIQTGECKTNFQQGPNNYRTGGVFTFTRTTPVIPQMAKMPSGNPNAAPYPQGTVRFAPLGSGSATARPAAPQAQPESVPVTSAQELAEIATRERLNREQAACAAKQVADNAAAKAAFDQATADRAATIARQQADHQASVAAFEAEKLRREREYAAQMAKWRADVEACKAGDKSRCAPQ